MKVQPTESESLLLEQLLFEQMENQEQILENKPVLVKRTPPHKAEKSATIYEFIEMVAMLVSKVMKDKKVIFVLDEGKRIYADPNYKLEVPHITYKILGRKPKELKPREREGSIQEVDIKGGNVRKGSVSGLKFGCEVQFNIIASEYTLANEVMDIFEDLIFSYTYYLKKNGVAEILFKDHLTDSDYDIYRQSVSVRNLIYYVEIEKLYLKFDTEIEEIKPRQ